MYYRRAKDKASSYPTGFPRGLELIHDPIMNKGTAFTHAERDALGLWGLLPPRVFTQEEQVMRVLGNFRRKSTDLERYIQMMALLDRNETLFYRVVMDHIETMMPIIYMPTVGQACKVYGHIFRKPRGVFLSALQRGRFAGLLRNWAHDEVRVIVVTDGERIFGLGDLGAEGMGTCVGKLVLYTTLAGVHPSHGLPVTLDVGTDNEELLEDPLYIGIQHPRLRGAAYNGVMEEFVAAVRNVFPDALIQFEDVATENAARLLKRYRDEIPTFNNDIQGRAAVILAGLYSALQITKSRLSDQKILFLGASEGAIAIADVIVAAMGDEGLSEEEARSRCWFVDSEGLIVKGRGDLAEHKLAYAHDHSFRSGILSGIDAVKPTAVIGVCGKRGSFTRPALEAMARYNERPIVFALSRPSSQAECTAEEAHAWTGGRAIFADSGPAATDAAEGDEKASVHMNTAYISPGLVLGAVACEASLLTDEMFVSAARALANEVSNAELKAGQLFPPLKRIREVSPTVAAAVAEVAYDRGIAKKRRPKNLMKYIKSRMYEPVYPNYV